MKEVIARRTALSLALGALTHFGSHFCVSTEQHALNWYEDKKLKIERAYLAYTGRSSSKPYTAMELKTLSEAAAVSHGLNPILVSAVIEQESSWNPNSTSSVGAAGLMQVRPWWLGRGVCSKWRTMSELYSPEANLDCGTSILSDEITKAKNLTIGLERFNGGEHCQQTPSCKAQTEKYASAIIARILTKLKI